jgi:hypothetical protein
MFPGKCSTTRMICHLKLELPDQLLQIGDIAYAPPDWHSESDGRDAAILYNLTISIPFYRQAFLCEWPVNC